MTDSATERPARHVTANQVVAWNVRFFRLAAGLTQEQAGALAGGWSGPSLGEAERSWTSDVRVKKFDADEMAALALALGVPVTALFLPPEGDGPYVMTGDRDRRYDEADWLALAVMPDNDDDTPVMAAYRDRFNAAARRWLDPQWAVAVARWLSGTASPATRATLAARLLDRERALLDAAAEMGQLAAAIIAGDEDEGEAPDGR